MLEGAQVLLQQCGLSDTLPLQAAILTADCNYHSETNLEACAAHGVEAYIPDNHFRQRDPRFATQERHKEALRSRKEFFGLERFTYQEKNDTYLCPQGEELTLQSARHGTGDGHQYRRYRAKARACAKCPLQAQCIARGGTRRSLALPIAGEAPGTLTARMRQKIDTPEARDLYARRLANVEPVFGNLRSNKRLDRFTYRGLGKVSVQWQLYCLVHNLEKIAHYGKKYGGRDPKRPSTKPLGRLTRPKRAFRRRLRARTAHSPLLQSFRQPCRPTYPSQRHT